MNINHHYAIKTAEVIDFCLLLEDDPNIQQLDAESPYTYKSSPLITNLQSDTNRSTRRIRRQGDLSYVYIPGIVDECCKKPCTQAVLMSYCRVPIDYVLDKQ